MSKLVNLSESDLNNRNKGLIDISKILQMHKVPFMLSDGVLLGAIRDRNFIKWDWDVELSVKVEDIYSKSDDLLESLKENDFLLTNVTLRWKNYKICANKYGTKYSLIGFFEQGQNRMRSAWVYPSEFFDKLEEHSFLGNKYMIPSPPENYLEYQYGDWKTPVRSTIKRNYLTSKVYRENRYFMRALHHLKTKLEKLSIIAKKYLKAKIIVHYKRENNFQLMYQYCLSEKISIVEIGSSDGREASIALKKSSNKIKSIHIVEPDIRNLKIARKSISRYDKANKVSYHNKGIGDFCGKGEFYLHNRASNLNASFNLDDEMQVVEIEYLTLQEFIESNNIVTPLLIKMDIEGYEIEVLKNAMKYISSLNSVYILLELHPNHYSKNRSMHDLLDFLFENGFKPLMIESAGVRVPKLFKEKDLRVVNFDKNRGLFHCNDKEFIKYVCSRNIHEKIDEYHMTAKIARSLLIGNINQL